MKEREREGWSGPQGCHPTVFSGDIPMSPENAACYIYISISSTICFSVIHGNAGMISEVKTLKKQEFEAVYCTLFI